MNINQIFEEAIKEEFHLFLNKYKTQDYLSTDEVAKELGLGSGDNLRKQIKKYKGLYKQEGSSKKPRYKWVKFLVAKHIYNKKVDLINL